jgi:tripartite-type tricarboxylate transporter receptor subunit TctC
LAISREPDIRDEFVRQGLIPVESTSPEELKEYVRSQIAYWRQTLPKIGLAGIE